MTTGALSATGPYPPGQRAATWAATALLVVAVGATYSTTLAGLIRQWETDANYSHGFLVVPLALYFAWRRRAAVIDAGIRPMWWGLAGACAAMVLYAAGRASADLFIARLSLPVLVVSAVAFVLGGRAVRVLAFPLAFIVLMVPLPALLFNEIAFPLQQMAAAAGEAALRTGGVPVIRQGNVLELSSVSLDVAQACSGVRSLMTLVAVAAALGELGRLTGPRRLALIAATIPLALLTNAARVALTGLAADRFGPSVVEGLPHTVAGVATFAAAAAALPVIDRLLRPRRSAATVSC